MCSWTRPRWPSRRSRSGSASAWRRTSAGPDAHGARVARRERPVAAEAHDEAQLPAGAVELHARAEPAVAPDLRAPGGDRLAPVLDLDGHATPAAARAAHARRAHQPPSAAEAMAPLLGQLHAQR